LKDSNNCAKCGQNFKLAQEYFQEDRPVNAKNGLQLCPECYRNLSNQELETYMC